MAAISGGANDIGKAIIQCIAAASAQVTLANTGRVMQIAVKLVSRCCSARFCVSGCSAMSMPGGMTADEGDHQNGPPRFR